MNFPRARGFPRIPPLARLGLVVTAAMALIFLSVPTVAAHPERTAGTPGSSPEQPCTCAEARLADGWCGTHRVGYVAMVRIPSRLVYDALDAHGHVLDLDTFTCPACRKAIDAGGFCDEHHTGFVRKEAYFSRLTYEMARGERLDPAGIACPACRRNSASLGWCARDGRGMVGVVAIRDRSAYDRAAAAVTVVRAAAETVTRCEGCAVAMVTDTECWRCRITYRNGLAQPRVSPSPVSPPR